MNINENTCFSWNLQNCDFCYTSAVKTWFFNIQVSQKYIKINEKSMEIQCLKKVVNIVTKLCQNDPKWDPKTHQNTFKIASKIYPKIRSKNWRFQEARGIPTHVQPSEPNGQGGDIGGVCNSVTVILVLVSDWYRSYWYRSWLVSKLLVSKFRTLHALTHKGSADDGKRF